MSERNGAVLKRLSGGLVMRRSTPADADRLPDFNGRIHGDNPFETQGLAVWTRDLLTRPHPTFNSDDFIIVEDTQSGEIVSSLNLISQTWAYEGIPFGVGRPELVGTNPEYRGRGLVREQFEIMHEWSRQRGELVQVITGIPFFYRQFDYEMALELGGGRGGYEPQVPKLPEGQEEPHCIRPAAETDLDWLMKMYARENERMMISAVRDVTHWRDELLGKSPENFNRFELRVIETRDGQRVGYLVHPATIWNAMMPVIRYELAEGVSYLSVNPTVMRYLWSTGQELARKRERPLNSFGFWFGSQHPAYPVAASRLVFERPTYAYYVRVPDLPAFLTHIGPALERRLSSSACAGHTGELKISFYRDGVRLVFENGRLVSAQGWKPKIKADEGMAAFPNLTFLQLIFGYRSLPELRYAYADFWANEEATALLEVLFPKKPSSVWSIS